MTESHGTIVASTAAGKNLGVAPEATIVPIAINLTDDQGATGLVNAALRLVIAALPNEGRSLLDDDMATSVTDNYAKFDVINRSHGTGLFDPDVVASAIDSELAWYRQYLPKTLDAVFQVNRPDAEKTILVYAAGNESEPWSTIEADLPYYIPEVRGHAVAVVATDPETGRMRTTPTCAVPCLRTGMPSTTVLTTAWRRRARCEVWSPTRAARVSAR